MIYHYRRNYSYTAHYGKGRKLRFTAEQKQCDDCKRSHTFYSLDCIGKAWNETERNNAALSAAKLSKKQCASV